MVCAKSFLFQDLDLMGHSKAFSSRVQFLLACLLDREFG